MSHGSGPGSAGHQEFVPGPPGCRGRGRLDHPSGPLGCRVSSFPTSRQLSSPFAHDLIVRHLDLTVVGITGSLGQDLDKDLLAQVLATALETVANVGSLNSEKVGVRLTVCASPRRPGVSSSRWRSGPAHSVSHRDRPHGSAWSGTFLFRSWAASHRLAGGHRGREVGIRPGAPDGLAVLNGDDKTVPRHTAAPPPRSCSWAKARRGRPGIGESDADGRSPRFTLVRGEHRCRSTSPSPAVTGSPMWPSRRSLDVGLSLEQVAAALATAGR